MSEDQIRLVQSLINSGEGDIERLQTILDTLQKGNTLESHDRDYLQELEKKLQSESPVTPTNPNLETNETPEERALDSQALDDDISKEAKTLGSNSSRKKRIITIAVIVAILMGTYAGLDVYAVTSLQFRPHHGNQHMISQTQIFIQSDVCNPSYFPASFNKYEINAVYKTDSIETAVISGSTISPKTYEILNGVFTLNEDTVMKLQQGNFTFDPNLAHVTTTVDAPIFGVIPFSVVKEYAGEEFQNVVKNGPPGSFTCG